MSPIDASLTFGARRDIQTGRGDLYGLVGAGELSMQEITLVEVGGVAGASSGAGGLLRFRLGGGGTHWHYCFFLEAQATTKRVSAAGGVQAGIHF